MRNAALLLGLALLAPLAARADTAALAGPGGGTYALPLKSLKEMRFRATVRQQYDFSCGSAALATLLTYQYGHPLTEEQAFREMYLRGDQAKIRREGFSLLDMKRLLHRLGFEADGFEAGLGQLVEAGLPAIAMIVENGYRHFVVVKGLRQGRVLFSDPSVGERLMSVERFESIWQERLLFVIHNRQSTARFNLAADWNLAPLAPLHSAIRRDGMLPPQRLGPTDF